MKLFKILGFIFILLLSMSSIMGTWYSGIAYYEFEDNALDTGSEGNNEDLTQVNTPTYNTGLVGAKAIHFEKTSNQYVVNAAFLGTELAKVRSVDFWVKVNGSNIGSVLSIGDGTNANRFEISTVNETHLDVFWLHGSVHQFSPSFQNFRFTTNNNWEQMIITFGAAGVKIYESGDTTPIFTNAATTTFDSNYDRISLGVSSNNDNWLTATLDNFFMTESIYTTANVTESYNSGAGCFFNEAICAGSNPAISFDNVSINNIINFNNTFYNTSPINLEVNLSTDDTNNNTNVTFFLYNSSDVLINTTQFMTNTLNGNLNIVFPYDGTFKFFLNASNNDTNTLSPIAPLTNYTIHFDGTTPSLIVTLPAEYGFYDNFNFSNFINVSDLNLVSCNIIISDETPTNCTNQSYSFHFNANHTINITATDLAGNVNSSLNNIMLINPEFKAFFNNNTDFVTDFLVNGTNYTNFFNGSTFDFGLGNHTFLFQKTGYRDLNFTLEFNSTARINETIFIDPVFITIFVRSVDNNSLVPPANFTILINNEDGITSDTFEIINNNTLIIVNDYALDTELTISLVTNDSIVSNVLVVNPRKDINISMYVTFLEEELRTFKVLSSALTIVPNSDVQLFTFIDALGTFVLQSQTKTSELGLVSFNIVPLLKIYTICNTFENDTACIQQATFVDINTDPSQIIHAASLEGNTQIFLDSISWTPIENKTNVSSEMTLIFNDAQALVTQFCMNVTRFTNNTPLHLGQFCASGSSGVITQTFSLLTDQRLEYTFLYEFESIFTPFDTFVSYNEDISFSELKRNSILDLFFLLLFFGGIGFLLRFNNFEIYSVGILIILIVIFIVQAVINEDYVTLPIWGFLFLKTNMIYWTRSET